MNVKGFLIQDGQGKEFMVACRQPYAGSRTIFSLRGWQRRRLVPLQCTEQELRQIVAGALLTLNDLFLSLPRFVMDTDEASCDTERSLIPASKVRKTP